MGYKRLNAEAMKVIKQGGLLFTFSCSQVVDTKLFYNTVMSAAIQVGRAAKVMHHLTQPTDHPVNIYHPEGEYLKGLVLWIE
jgi:23S rRNA (cytosine1962-C5)-methyltransferase